jgi:hypothetical protein
MMKPICLFLVALAAACSTTQRGGLGATCNFSADCEEQFVCSLRVCSNPCHGPKDCAEGLTCSSQSTCVPIPDVTTTPGPDASKGEDGSVAMPEAGGAEGGPEASTQDAADQGDSEQEGSADDAPNAPDAPNATDAPQGSEGGTVDAGADGPSCARDPRVDPYTPNSTKPGQEGALTFTLVKIDPVPPVLGNNAFTVKVAVPDGGSYAADLRATINMPDHTHPASLQPTVQYDFGTGLYTVNSALFFMAGVWRLQLGVYPPASGDAGKPVDSTSFFFCVDP